MNLSIRLLGTLAITKIVGYGGLEAFAHYVHARLTW
jgi:hypothetical protein